MLLHCLFRFFPDNILYFRLNQSVGIALSLIHYIYLICLRIDKYEEIMSQQLHLDAGILRIHRLDIKVERCTIIGGSFKKSAVGKIISDPNLSAEKISVLDNIEDVVGNANYVGSGEYVSHGSKNKSYVSRYDYFETEVSINGKEYIVSFDVEVHPNVNNYRTHKVINEINLTSSPDMGPLPTADNLISTNTGDSSSLFNNSIPNSGENVNANQKKQYNSNKIDGFEDLNKDLG